MAKSTKSWALGFLLLAAGLRAEDALITVQSTITASEVQGTVVSGSMQLSIVNATNTTLSNVRLRLAASATGTLGDGTVEVGTIEIDATAAPIVEFRITKAFFDSGDPLVITLIYRDAAGNDHEASITARRNTDGGGL